MSVPVTEMAREARQPLRLEKKRNRVQLGVCGAFRGSDCIRTLQIRRGRQRWTCSTPMFLWLAIAARLSTIRREPHENAGQSLDGAAAVTRRSADSQPKA